MWRPQRPPGSASVLSLYNDKFKSGMRPDLFLSGFFNYVPLGLDACVSIYGCIMYLGVCLYVAMCMCVSNDSVYV